MKDGLGNEIKPGDVVLYAEPLYNSAIRWSVRQVHSFGANRVYFGPERSYGWTQPHRVVVVKALLGQ